MVSVAAVLKPGCCGDVIVLSSCCHRAVLTMVCMAEVGRGLVVSRDITPQLVRVLRVNQSPEVIETALELVSNLADNGM